MRWLDHHAGSVTALATCVLVMVTAWYVRLTMHLARAQSATVKMAREANDLAMEQNRLAYETLQHDMEQRLRGQAKLVSAWPRPRTRSSSLGVAAVVEYLNGSAEPVFDCVFEVAFRDRGPVAAVKLAVIAPAERGELDVPIGAPSHLSDPLLLDLTFTDNAGVRWHRASDGDLHAAGSRGPAAVGEDA